MGPSPGQIRILLRRVGEGVATGYEQVAGLCDICMCVFSAFFHLCGNIGHSECYCMGVGQCECSLNVLRTIMKFNFYSRLCIFIVSLSFGVTKKNKSFRHTNEYNLLFYDGTGLGPY